MLRLTILTTVTLIAMADVPLHATSRTTCTAWESGNYTPTIDGVAYKCTSKRTCTTTETDPDGQCRKVFGCSTTNEIQFANCTKAAATGPATTGGRPPVGGVLDPGPRQPPKDHPSTFGTLKAQ